MISSQEQNKVLKARVDELEDALMIKLEMGQEIKPPEPEPEPEPEPPAPEPQCDQEGWQYSSVFDAAEESWVPTAVLNAGEEGSKDTSGQAAQVRRRMLYRVQVSLVEVPHASARLEKLFSAMESHEAQGITKVPPHITPNWGLNVHTLADR